MFSSHDLAPPQVSDFLARHGYHGPLEGEVSSRVWRDDDTPLRRVPPELGEQSREILRELGYTDEEAARIAAS